VKKEKKKKPVIFNRFNEKNQLKLRTKSLKYKKEDV